MIHNLWNVLPRYSKCIFIKSRTVCRSSNCTFRTCENVVRCPNVHFSREVTTTTYLNQVRRTERIALSVRRSQRISEQLVLVMFPLVTKHIAGKALWGTTWERERKRNRKWWLAVSRTLHFFQFHKSCFAEAHLIIRVKTVKTGTYEKRRENWSSE